MGVRSLHFAAGASALWKHIENVFPQSGRGFAETHFMHIKDVFPERDVQPLRVGKTSVICNQEDFGFYVTSHLLMFKRRVFVSKDFLKSGSKDLKSLQHMESED
jgi:hypothetical protein